MDDDELAGQRPRSVHEALACMEATLAVFGARAPVDRRVVFLRVYHEMTKEVCNAIDGREDYAGRPVFLDPDWVKGLSGSFASLYFGSLTVRDRKGERDRAWRAADRAAADERSAVLLNVLLGINAHINYDLAQAIAANLDDAVLQDPGALQRRRFDHDQVNNLLVRSMERIQDILARDHAPGLGVADRLMGRIDERLSQWALSHYRERVWDNAVTLALARAADRAQGRAGGGAAAEAVLDELDWESARLAWLIGRGGPALRWVERLLGMSWTGRRVARRITPEGRTGEPPGDVGRAGRPG